MQNNGKHEDLDIEIKCLEGKLVAAKRERYSPASHTPEQKAHFAGQKARLARCSWMIWAYLLAFTLAASTFTAIVLASWSPGIVAELCLATVAGVAGASLSGLISLNERIANGWEYEDGTREPDQAVTKERFNLRLVRGFLSRPYLGIVAGLLVLTGGQVGRLQAPKNSYDIAFFCLLGGLFSKTLFDWLKNSFKGILGK